MSEWKAKRFWTDATVEAESGGFAVKLDGRPLRSPLKTLIAMPSHALAEQVAAEWQAQDGVIDPGSMPLTRAVNATLDKVVPQRSNVVDGLSEYGTTDLLSYRAVQPAALQARQAAAWDPILDWMEAELGARLTTTQGVMPVPQAANTLESMRARVDSFSEWELTALSEFVSLSGSLVLALGVMAGRLTPEDAWELSRLDETFQAEQWGVDEEEAERIAIKRGDFLQAFVYLGLLRAG